MRLHTPLPPAKIGGANDPLAGGNNLRPESYYGPNAGLTEVLIPAGYVTTVYDPVFRLSDDRTRYISAASDTPTPLAGAGPAVLAGVPRRAGPRGCRAAHRLRLRSRLEAPHPAARLRPAAVNSLLAGNFCDLPPLGRGFRFAWQ